MKDMGDLFLHIVRTINREYFRPTERAVSDIVDMVFEESQREVPVDTGALKGSGKKNVTATQIGNQTVYAGTIEYGGETSTGPTRNAPDGVVHYAVIVHETNKPFLEIAWNNVRTKAERRVRRYMQQTVKQLAKIPKGMK